MHAREPYGQPHNADFFREQGLFVTEREYGTRVYREMFVIDGYDGLPIIEVRRNPASQGLNGIHDETECHIRLVNRGCYMDNAAEAFRKFLSSFGYVEWRISRVDVCLDFTEFDRGDDPQAFVRRYFKHRYSKINQGRISSHGDDTWSGQEWNSLSWGSKNSSVTTKMYNKTLELYDRKSGTYGKPYIRQAWVIAGLIDDWQHVTKEGVPVNVWRVEFSLRSPEKNWVRIELNGKAKNYQSLRNTLESFMGRDRILVMFAALANHYFRFKKYDANIRKDRCSDKVLFDFSGAQLTYKLGRNDYAAGDGKTTTDKLERLIQRLTEYRNIHIDPDIRKACDILITSMSDEDMRNDLAHRWSNEEYLMMKGILNLRLNDANMTFDVAMTEVKRLLNITNRTINAF